MKDLKHRAVKSVFWVTLANIISRLIYLGSVAYLARQVSKADFGVFSIVTTIITISITIVSFGFDWWYVKSRSNETKHYNTFVKIGIISVILLAILQFLGANYIGYIFHDNAIAIYLKYLSVFFIIGGSSQLLYQYLAKHLEFGKTAQATVVRQIIQALVSITVAFYIPSATALIIGFVAGGITEFTILFIFGKKAFISSIKQFNKTNIFQIFRKDYKQTLGILGSQVINVTARLLPPFIIGTTINLGAAGLFTVMDNLITMPINLIIGAISSTSLSVFSKITHRKLAPASIRLSSLTLAITAPFFIYIWLFADIIIAIFLGPTWTDGGTILKLLAIASFINVAASPISQNFIVRDKAPMLFWWNAIFMIGNVLTLYFGSKQGLLIAAEYYTVFNIFMRLALQELTCLILKLPLDTFIKLYIKFIPLWAVIALIGYLVTQVDALKYYAVSGYMIIGLGLYWLILLVFYPNVFKDIKSIIGTLKRRQ